MALFYHGLNRSEVALRHIPRALLLLSWSSGPDHPDVAATYINVAMMCQDIGKMNMALRYLQEALEKQSHLTVLVSTSSLIRYRFLVTSRGYVMLCS